MRLKFKVVSLADIEITAQSAEIPACPARTVGLEQIGGREKCRAFVELDFVALDAGKVFSLGDEVDVDITLAIPSIQEPTS